MSHGKVGHHLKVLERAGLIEVIEERKVRALTERIFAPTFEYLRVELHAGGVDRLSFLFQQAAREAAPAADQPFDPVGRLYSVKMSEQRAGEFSRRLVELADEFGDSEDEEGSLFGLAGAVYQIEVSHG